ncbi:ABC transporter ATP-binding protein [Rhodoferax sp.]|uniref:ABC transporter ATP-binding protein n=1 Tax=Rhodoferax sp. TaxID=50421 RepID=UPI0026021A3F|nr:ABC transporter ATP-binding protein [Rhodoferax sp.]MDD2923723.1 ABC transporter ATP-binding protein [Rhodoferax sp.]
MSLKIESLHKHFAGLTALDNIDLQVGAAEFVCLLGPSGCGKTTLLRIIAGLLSADGGRILLDQQDLAMRPARERGFGIVFQSYSLFPHMTVAQNVGYGLTIRHTPQAEVQQRVSKLLQTVKLAGFEQRYPAQLSGGQQQRVAIARALAVNPALLLLDEPLSALDARVRADLRLELREVQRQLGIPTLMVTHDQEEAMAMADRIVCMNHGHIEQVGTPQELYLRPHTRFVANFMGHSNLMSREQVQTYWPQLLAHAPADADNDHLALCVRPERLQLKAQTGAAGRVGQVSFLGSIQRIHVHWMGQDLLAETSSATPFAPGDTVQVDVAPQDCAWITA